MDAEVDATLVCVKCGLKSEGDALGWRTFLTDDDQAAVYCRECSWREFGDV